MRILVIGYMHAKFDKRVYKTVEALSKRHEVIYQYWTDRNEEQAQFEEKTNIKYVPVIYTKGTQGNPLKKLMNRRRLDKRISQLIEQEEYDILYMHHFLASRPLKPFKIAKTKKKKIIYDVHEFHPENFLANLKGMSKTLKEHVMWNVFKKQLQLSDNVIFVSEEMKNYVLGKMKFKNKKVLVMPNYASFATKANIEDKKREIIYVGKTPRNLEKEAELLNRLAKEGFSFKVVGNSSQKIAGISHVSVPFLPYKDMMKEISRAMFSLISYMRANSGEPRNDSFALPHKYFDSLAAGTPVIVRKDFLSMANQVKRLGVGTIIDPEDVERSVEKVIKAYSNYSNILRNVEIHQHEFVWSEDKEKQFLEFVLS